MAPGVLLFAVCLAVHSTNVAGGIGGAVVAAVACLMKVLVLTFPTCVSSFLRVSGALLFDLRSIEIWSCLTRCGVTDLETIVL